MKAFAINHFGLLSAAVGVGLASALYFGGGPALGMIVACFVALSMGDAWDEEGRP